jgi:dolichol kinase
MNSGSRQLQAGNDYTNEHVTESKQGVSGKVSSSDLNSSASKQAVTVPVQARQITFSSEVIRKTIHIGSLSIPVGYYYITKETALTILIPLTIFSIAIDVGRHYIPPLKRMVTATFGRILRPHERESGLLSGATYVLISALFCVFVFPKMITITAFAVLIVSDASSALIGRAFGKHKFLDKSLEGTLAFVVSAWLVILLTPKAGPVASEYLIGAFAVIIGGIAEAWSVTLRFDDNFSVPVSIGFTMWGLYYLLDRLSPVFHSVYRAMLNFS